eukprot:gnl/MRDRNA2_/MRDRNA2_89782_c0_seq1.p1 gnl/MRDRNA2_/MRDRNA2_89782_c0~~gnl/MRDRNA2_/MRDRNA2_89782_c0_seq1.p1  ORF type:complete len:227 (+),score=23.54 gnl/MRDRNA2_/MRDRNA2_89782_c0_seq1:68-748(+)
MQKSASDSKLPSWPRYFYFTDNSMQKRVRDEGPRGGRKKKNAVVDDPLAQLDQPEESIRAESGWDKYFFFSVTADKGIVSKAARMGRSRPAKTGPQTFLLEDFSPEEFAKAKNSRGAAQFSMYSQSYSQLPRSSTILQGTGSQSMMPTIKDLQAPLWTTSDRGVRRAAAQEAKPASNSEKGERQLVADYPTTMTPHIFPTGHKTFVELFATDKPAPRGVTYTIFPN